MTTKILLVMGAMECADRLGLSASTLAKMRLYGTGPVFSKLGRRVVYRLEDLEAWIAANRYLSTSEYPVSRVQVCGSSGLTNRNQSHD